jgi:hypothetical protein
MKRCTGPTALLAVLVLSCPGIAADKKNDPAAKGANAKDYQALADAHTVTGKVNSVGGSDKSLSLRVDYQVVQPNPAAARNNNAALQRILRDEEQILRTRNPLRRFQEMERLQAEIVKLQAQGLKNAYKVVNQHKDFDLESGPDVVVRRLEPPVEYDDKGNAKKRTAAELKELKGKNPDLPGYNATFDDLRIGQVVRVTLARPKADKDKPKDKDAADDKKPQVSMIVILTDPPAPKPKGKKDK